MEKIIAGYMDLSQIEHGTIKYNFVSNKFYFDELFIKEFDLPYRFMNGVKFGNKSILSNSDLHKLTKVIRKIKSSDIFQKFEFVSNGNTRYLFIKRMIQVEDEYIYAYFLAPKLADYAPNYEVNKVTVELFSDLTNATHWYVDLSVSPKKYFSSSPLYGTYGEEVESDESRFYSFLNKAVEENVEYRTFADILKKSVMDLESGAIESYRCQYPLKIDRDILWLETISKVTSRDELGNPKLVIGVDIIRRRNDEIELESEMFDQTINSCLNNSDVGYWLMTVKDEVKTFRYNAKLRELYGYSEHITIQVTDVDYYDDKFEEAKRRVLKKYPEYIEFFNEDIRLFNKLLSNEIDDYRSILPFLDKGDKVTWMEARASVIGRDELGQVTSVAGVSIDVTELFESKKMESLFDKTKIEVNKANKSAIEMMEVLIWSINYNEYPKGDFFYGNESYVEKLGLDKNEKGLVNIQDYFDSIIEGDEYSIELEDVGRYTQKIKEGKINGFEGLVLKHRNNKTGEILYGSHSAKVVSRSKNGKVEFLSGFFIDVTAEIEERKLRRRAEDRALEARKFNRLAIQAGKLMVFNISYFSENRGREVYANNYFIDLLEIESVDNHLSYEDYKQTIYFDDEGRKLFEESEKQYLDVLKGVGNGVVGLLTKHKSLKTGTIYYLEHNSHVEGRNTDGKVTAIGGFLRDVTNDILNERRIEYLAKMDSLTDVFNRNQFELCVADVENKDVTILLFDIDGLKLANDIYGHQVGDEVLKVFSKVLKYEFPDGKIFRIGGDEFAVLLEEVSEEILIERLKEVELSLEELTIKDGVQIGVSSGYEAIEGRPFETAFMIAENQMYRKKLSARSSRKSKTLDTLMVTLGEKTEETNEHCDRLSELAQKTYQKLGFHRSAELYDIGLAARLHDIGKITIPLEILNKPGRLTIDEFETVKKHSEAGYKIVFNLINSDDIAEGVLYHHERFDGQGYPYGLFQSEIPLYARIISVCDAYDAMISERPYSSSKTVKEAIIELKKNAGTQFDPKVVDAFELVINDDEKGTGLLDKE